MGSVTEPLRKHRCRCLHWVMVVTRPTSPLCSHMLALPTVIERSLIVGQCMVTACFLTVHCCVATVCSATAAATVESAAGLVRCTSLDEHSTPDLVKSLSPLRVLVACMAPVILICAAFKKKKK